MEELEKVMRFGGVLVVRVDEVSFLDCHYARMGYIKEEASCLRSISGVTIS